MPVSVGFTDLQRRILNDRSITVIDVGANVGQYAERLRDIGCENQIVSFEPGSAAFSILADRARKEPRWEVRQKALGPRPGTEVLRVSGNSVSSSLLDIDSNHVSAAPRSATVSHETVNVSTLDLEFAGWKTDPFWLKLDVQGFELQVLEGASQMLPRTQFVQAEVSFAPLYEGQTDWLALCMTLREQGFALRHMEPGFQDLRTGYVLQADVLFTRD
jgi:FkbM family methyltransferase